MKNKLPLRLTIIFISLATVPLLIVGVLLAQRNYAVISGQAINLQSEVAQRVAKDVNEYISSRESELRVLTNIRNVMLQSKEEQLLTLTGLMATQDTYQELALLDATGQEVVRVAALKSFADEELQNRAGLPEFEAAKASGQVYYSPVQFDETTGEAFLVMAVPSFDVRTGQFAGVLTANIFFSPIWDMMSGAKIAGDGIVYIVDAENRVIAHRDPSIVLQGTQFARPAADGFSVGLSGEEAAIASSLSRFGTQEFYTVAEVARTEALSLAIMTTVLIGVVFLAALTVAIVISIIVARQIGHMSKQPSEAMRLATDSMI